LLVYLYRSVDHLLQNIKKRGRSYEEEITPEYLQNIQDAYLDYFKVETDIPVLIIDLQNYDFVSDKEVYRQIKSSLMKEYSPGVHKLLMYDE